MQGELQVWQLVLDASWMVKFVMLILLLASVIRGRLQRVHAHAGATQDLR